MEDDDNLDQAVELMDGEAKRRMAELMEMADQELAKILLKKMLTTLIANIESGLATASDLNVARALLKDNNIGIVPTRDNAAGILQQRLAANSERAASNPGVISPSELNSVDIDDFVGRSNG